MMILEESFYNRNSLIVAEELLGKVLVHKDQGRKIAGKIVETEAYRGPIDKAAHSYNNRRTSRTEVMFGPPGRAYIYMIYGLYQCMNVVCEREGLPEAVLIRAIEPVEGLEEMAINRYGRSYADLKRRDVINLTSGPGKLCKAMNIQRELNGRSLMGDEIYILDNLKEKKERIVKTKRIGIDYAEEAKDFLWRFYIKDNIYVSKK